jgi:hypothetical protein
MGIWYATREQIMRSLEILQSAYAGSLIDAKLEWASRSIDYQTHRRFYPERRTISRDWPSARDGLTWAVDLGDQEMISLEVVNSGGTAITSSCYLSRDDDLAEPPYHLLQVDLSTAAAFAAGPTFQRSLQITGLYGTKNTDTSLPGGALSAAINSTSTNTITINPSSGIFTPGIGSLLLVDTERMVVRDRQMITSGQTISASISDVQSARVITSSGASNFAAGEVILIDGERMLINEISGTSLLVTRAWDGTALDTHSSGATIYALRQFIVTRGALGSTAATHLISTSVYPHTFEVNEWCIAETVCALEQNSSAYARTVGSGASAREAVGAGLEDVRNQGYAAYGRKGRSAAV